MTLSFLVIYFFCFYSFYGSYCILDSSVEHDGYSISSEGFLPAVVDIMVIYFVWGYHKLLYKADIRDSLYQ